MRLVYFVWIHGLRMRSLHWDYIFWRVVANMINKLYHICCVWPKHCPRPSGSTMANHAEQTVCARQSPHEYANDLFPYFPGIPAAERFSFCLNTLLSDIASCCPNEREEIILAQVETLNALTNIIKSSQDSGAVPPLNLCKATVPILLGLGRSMGRYAQNIPPLLCRLFPRPEMPQKPKQDIIPISYERQQGLSQFRSIIPRSLSGGLSCDALNDEQCLKEDRPSLQSYFSVPYDATTYFFSKYGSSFNQFPNMRFNETPEKKPRIQFSIQHLQTIFSIAKKLLTKEILDHLDEQANEVYLTQQIKSFGYKSFSETVNLVMVTLLRELLQNQTGMKTSTSCDLFNYRYVNIIIIFQIYQHHSQRTCKNSLNVCFSMAKPNCNQNKMTMKKNDANPIQLS